MPRYDDRHGNSTRLYVGHLSSRTRSRDLEYLFGKYGRVRDVDMKQDFAFVDFSDPRDADDAIYQLNGRDVDGRRIVVELARGVPRGPGGVREYLGRGPAPGSGRCFNCGLDGHWARDCTSGDWKNKCYRCGERGHIERNCNNSPKKTSYSRSPVPRSRSPRRGGRARRSYSRSPSLRRRSYSRSVSPRGRGPIDRSLSPPVRGRGGDRSISPPVRGRGGDRSLSPPVRGRGGDRSLSPPVRGRGGDRSLSPPVRGRGGDRSASPPARRRIVDRSLSPTPRDRSVSRSPYQRSPDGPGSRKRSLSPYDADIKERRSPSPKRGRLDSRSPPRMRNRSPDGPYEPNGVSPGRDGRSPVDERRAPRGSESP